MYGFILLSLLIVLLSFVIFYENMFYLSWGWNVFIFYIYILFNNERNFIDYLNCKRLGNW